MALCYPHDGVHSTSEWQWWVPRKRDTGTARDEDTDSQEDLNMISVSVDKSLLCSCYHYYDDNYSKPQL